MLFYIILVVERQTVDKKLLQGMNFVRNTYHQVYCRFPLKNTATLLTRILDSFKYSDKLIDV